MQKRINVLFLLSTSIALFLIIFFSNALFVEDEIEYVKVVISNDDNNISDSKIKDDKYCEKIEYKAQKEILSTYSIEDDKEWFLVYKELIDKYSDVLNNNRTIYDDYSYEDLTLLFRVVEAEATEGSFIEKRNVASVIFNRIKSEKFGNTLKNVLNAKEFSSISDGRYLKVNITEDTVLACEYAYIVGDTTRNALFFEGKNSNVHSSYAKYLFTDKIGHKFYTTY